MTLVGRTGVACVLAVLALGACGERAPLPQGCIEAQSEDVLQALTDAPRAVALADGTPISSCVEHAIDDAQLQALGTKLTGAADELATQMHAGDGDGDAALQLGYLIGAVTRGSARAAGFQSDLVDRIENAAGLDGGRHREALLRGRAAGRRGG
jgi:hypothetical protein